MAGASTYVWSWKIGIGVALVMLAVIASYRQTVHAYPSGGGDYEVATVNLGRTAGTTVASALLVDYVLTVAVSISSGAQYTASALPVFHDHEATLATVHGAAARGDEPARHPGVGHGVRDPDLRVHGRRSSGCAPSASSGWSRATCPTWRARSSTCTRRPATREALTTIALIFLLARAFSSGLGRADRCRGDLQRRAGVPQAEVAQRRDHAAAARR